MDWKGCKDPRDIKGKEKVWEATTKRTGSPLLPRKTCSPSSPKPTSSLPQLFPQAPNPFDCRNSDLEYQTPAPNISEYLAPGTLHQASHQVDENWLHALIRYPTLPSFPSAFQQAGVLNADQGFSEVGSKMPNQVPNSRSLWMTADTVEADRKTYRILWLKRDVRLVSVHVFFFILYVVLINFQIDISILSWHHSKLVLWLKKWKMLTFHHVIARTFW